MEPARDSRPRLAASSYSNTAPLIWSFVHGPRQGEVCLLTDTAPARCADMLAQGLVDGALVPAIEYQHLENVLAVPDVCVGSRRQVRSVVFATRCADLQQVRSVALDTSSRTSVALIKIIFREFIGVEPEWISHPPDLPAMLAAADAALLIGDPAMTFQRSGLQVFDLAGVWREFTGRAFVFAFWMARADTTDRVAAIDFAAARDEGLARVDEIAEFYAQSTGLPAAELVEYLTSNISFVLDEEMLAGLHLYYELAHKHGLIPSVRELKFVNR
ncbi:MAG: menaquinone biosynthesis protein [Pyrinomonadaceae bacterium]